MFTYPFEIIKARLQTVVTEQRETDWYMNQDSMSDKNASIKTTPAIYIEFLPVETRDEGQRIQSAEAEFNIILITECLYDNGSRRLKKDNAKDHMIIFDKINQALSGYSARLSVLPDFVALANTPNDMRVFNSITRNGITPPVAIKALMKSTQKFKTMVWDHAAQIAYTTPETPPTLDLTTTLE